MVRAVFMGSDSFSVPVLEALVEQGPQLEPAVEVVAVVTQPDRPAGRGRKQRESAVKTLALERGWQILQPAKIRSESAIQEFSSTAPELLVVASYGQILPDAVLNGPRHGSLNLHPSLLPKYRGPSPIVAPILQGEETTGTTLMLMSSRMDAGPIIAQRSAPIEAEETAGELETRLSLLSAELLLDTLPEWLGGRIEPSDQSEEAATYTNRIEKQDAEIDWSRCAEDLARQVRAFNPWPVAFTWWKGGQLRIFRARVADGAGEPGTVIGEALDGILVGTGKGVLNVLELQLPGGRVLPARDVVRGRRELLEAHFGVKG
jgi:methionyl-tRNA formyltransferase